ncbi:enoyl-CoA hydratase [Pseudomonas typographi]|uniref:Enoyl-CoA hydratase n=1 Tax=Pseudomonas typographi TaxID=2715964 RepID=A0ABR7Z1T6_9PSED|nr:enoyl-CoA hydratase [Pseudomonas typographi]MBD1551522.1 enoyl-CoA hydratase [Pseudomonas typographi]MBD1587492.1 enoyl-CoA hydratase [Pseudomonas typographi]MBD1599425.1 enoyl-CoA hydratase [Pseudomonas typographi]
MDNAKILVDIHGHTALLTLNNPAANTWDRESLVLFESILHTLERDRNIYALVITGQGEKFFSAGADLKQFADGNRETAREVGELFGRAFEALSRFPGVSIAAINGYAMGGGLECALACDLRIAEEQAQMALPEATVGLLPCAGGTQNLPWLVGEGWAKRMILCGERVDAATALSIGLVEEVVPRQCALERALQLAKQAAKQSPVSVRRCKALIMHGRSHTQASGWARERALFLELFNCRDQQEGVQAFLEKRSPQWVNG